MFWLPISIRKFWQKPSKDSIETTNCGMSQRQNVPVFLMQSRGDYSAAGTEKEICVAPVMASADSIVMGDVSTLRVAKEPS